MGISVTFKIYRGSDFNGSGDKATWKPAYKEGQIIFVKEQGKIFLDFDNERTCYTSDVSSSSGGMNFIGIVDDEPKTSTVSIRGKGNVTAKENDMVVWGKKEYIYRKGDDGLNWYEIGDEDAPSWDFDG